MLNIGDTVHITPTVPERDAEFWLFNRSMDDYCGKDAVIEEIIHENYGDIEYTGYRLDVDGKAYVWVDAWLTPVDAFDPPTKEEFDTEFDKLLM